MSSSWQSPVELVQYWNGQLAVRRIDRMVMTVPPL